MESVREETEAEEDEPVAVKQESNSLPEKPKASSLIELPDSEPPVPSPPHTPNATTDMRPSSMTFGAEGARKETADASVQIATPVREIHAVITHHRALSALSGHRGFGSGTLSPPVMVQQIQSPARSAHMRSTSIESGENSSITYEGVEGSELESAHSTLVLSDEGRNASGVEACSQQVGAWGMREA